MITSSKIIFKALDFINARNTGNIGEYKMWEDGEVTLYSSCFAVMLYHYFGALPKFSKSQLKQWAEYINSWQDRETGYFIGPEIRSDELINKKHNYEHVLMHLSAHVLPALDILGVSPKYPLKFAHKFLVANNLTKWLENRDWNDAWLEGNNLLFIGQFLVYLRDQEKKNKASQSLKFYFDWLDSQLDPATGLWGTNGYCSNFVAMCGGYHQLLVYYYENRNILYKKNLIDTVLSLQHKDGGFSPAGGGGACEDVDACDILVNLYKQIDYRRSEIRVALRKLLKAVITKQMLDGGFVYKKDVSFIHMGVGKTKSPANVSNMFATWFRIHTIALIDEILGDKKKSLVNWNFNNVCSMGWHRKWEEQLNFSNYCMDLIVTPLKKVVINFLLFPKKILAKIYYKFFYVFFKKLKKKYLIFKEWIASWFYFCKNPKKHKFHIVTSFYNCEKWIEKCLNSVYRQKYPNDLYTHIVINDCSNDKSDKIIKQWMRKYPDNKVKYFFNKKNQGLCANNTKGFLLSDTESIILELNGDDWLPDKKLFSFLNRIYCNSDIWNTYNSSVLPNGNALSWIKKIPDHITKNNSFRQSPWVSTHLHSFRAKLFSYVKENDLINAQTNTFWTAAVDRSHYYPILELAGTHSRHIYRTTYVYNLNENSLAKIKLDYQRQCERKIRQMPKYQPLKNL